MTPVAADIVFQVEIFHVAVSHVAVLFFWIGLLMIVSSMLLPLHIVICDSVFFSVGVTSVVFVQEWSTNTRRVKNVILRKKFISIVLLN